MTMMVNVEQTLLQLGHSGGDKQILLLLVGAQYGPLDSIRTLEVENEQYNSF